MGPLRLDLLGKPKEQREMKFRLLAGAHIQKEAAKDEQGNDVKVNRTYTEGDIVESSKDLVKLLGAGKFQLVRGGTAAAESDTAELDGMTIAQLKEYAASFEIDLEGVERKADIVTRIRAALG